MLAVVEQAFLRPIISPQRVATDCDDGCGLGRTLLVMPAISIGSLTIVKIVTELRGTNAGLHSQLFAYDDGGGLLAVVEAHQLTARRTAAASVLAARAIAAGRMRKLAVLGAGRQARAQIEAYADALPLESITLWARRPEAAQDLADFCAGRAKSIQIAPSPDDAVAAADIVTCATASEAPLFSGASVQPGAHIDLVGGFRPAMREADDALMRRATIVADTPVALREAGDLLQPLASGAIRLEEVSFLGDLLSGKRLERRGDVTLFKSVGFAAEDLVVAEMLLQRLGVLTSEQVRRDDSAKLREAVYG